MKTSIVLCVVLCLSVQLNAEPKRYDGYKVYRISVENGAHLRLLKHYEGHKSIDFWTDLSKVSKHVDVMVGPEIQESFELKLKSFPRSSVMVEDVQKLIDQQNLEQSQTKYNRKDITFDQYYNYEQIQQYLKDLESGYPDLASVQSIGKSYEGRSIDLIKISSGGNGERPAIFIDAGIHAREWAAPASALYLIQQLVENYADNKDIVDTVDWYIVPVANPDGYEYSQSDDRLWRKTREPNGADECKGTDANRNYDFHWGESGSSSDPCSEIYKGSAGFSTAEASALSEFEKTIVSQEQAYIALHTYAQVVLYPYSYDEIYPDDWEDLDDLGNRAADAIASVRGTIFDVGNSAYLLGTTAGCSDDYAKGALGVKYAYTFELYGDIYGFVLPPRLISAVVTETFEGLKVVGQQIGSGKK